MGSLERIAEERTDLDTAERERLTGLVGAWGLVADLAVSDLVLWLPTWNGAGWVAAALVRPATAPTSVPVDLVGSFVPRGREAAMDRALATGRVTRRDSTSGFEAVPVRGTNRVMAVLARHAVSRAPGHLDEAYREIADMLLQMIAEGTFPPVGYDVDPGSAPPRVGDGLIRLDADGRVVFASPNALSAFRRLGLAPALEGSDLAHVATRLRRRPGPLNERIALVAGGRVDGHAEIDNAAASVTVRSVVLNPGGVRRGAVVLTRDVTDLRRRERALVSKDATIREIHHRVKNNLQTVSALLRLQSRRVDADEARIALAEAGRRVAVIAAIHEILAQEPGDTIDFDAVVDRLVVLARDLAPAFASAAPSIARVGAVGVIPTDAASPLAMAVSELLHNAVEHAHAASITVALARSGKQITVTISDDGIGIPADVVEGLGLQIVRTLIEEDLEGQITMAAAQLGDPHRTPGTEVTVTIEVG